jgi:hypothetical protein
MDLVRRTPGRHQDFGSASRIKPPVLRISFDSTADCVNRRRPRQCACQPRRAVRLKSTTAVAEIHQCSICRSLLFCVSPAISTNAKRFELAFKLYSGLTTPGGGYEHRPQAVFFSRCRVGVVADDHSSFARMMMCIPRPTPIRPRSGRVLDGVRKATGMQPSAPS